MACARPNILHKQKSCVTDFTTTRIRDRRSQFLHKQYSIDETNLGHQRHPNHNGIGRNEPVVTTAEHNFISQRSSRQYWQPSSSPKRFHRKTQAWTSDNVTCPENSLRISTAIKCKSNEINVNDRCVCNIHSLTNFYLREVRHCNTLIAYVLCILFKEIRSKLTHFMICKRKLSRIRTYAEFPLKIVFKVRRKSLVSLTGKG